MGWSRCVRIHADCRGRSGITPTERHTVRERERGVRGKGRGGHCGTEGAKASIEQRAVALAVGIVGAARG